MVSLAMIFDNLVVPDSFISIPHTSLFSELSLKNCFAWNNQVMVVYNADMCT